MKIKNYLFIILLLPFCVVWSQESFNAGGGDDFNSEVILSYSIGQAFFQPFESSGNLLNVQPGVQQSYAPSGSGIEQAAVDVSKVQIYPNPVLDYLHLSISDMKLYQTQASLHNMSGKFIAAYKITDDITQINMQLLPTGVYFLRLNNNGANITTFKVIKK